MNPLDLNLTAGCQLWAGCWAAGYGCQTRSAWPVLACSVAGLQYGSHLTITYCATGSWHGAQAAHLRGQPVRDPHAVPAGCGGRPAVAPGAASRFMHVWYITTGCCQLCMPCTYVARIRLVMSTVLGDVQCALACVLLVVVLAFDKRTGSPLCSSPEPEPGLGGSWRWWSSDHAPVMSQGWIRPKNTRMPRARACTSWISQG